MTLKTTTSGEAAKEVGMDIGINLGQLIGELREEAARIERAIEMLSRFGRFPPERTNGKTMTMAGDPEMRTTHAPRPRSLKGARKVKKSVE